MDEMLVRPAETMDRDATYAQFTAYAMYIDKYIPEYISANERAHFRTSFDPHTNVLWHLVETGRLQVPENLGAACTMLYEWEK